jgi:NADH-quinone oxidoreductase subunit J
MNVPFLMLAVLTAGSALAAMTLRNLVHCALCLIGTFVGLAGIYLQLDAQFVGFAQVLVYVGAVGILIVFAILLTRSSEPPAEPAPKGSPALVGVGIAVFVFATLATVAASLSGHAKADPIAAHATLTPVKSVGTKLMTDYVLPLEIIGLLLTAAMIGAVIIAMKDKEAK